MNIPCIQSFDCNIEKAMSYVYNKQYGYMKELKPFGKEALDSMKTAGFLKTGWTKEEETFGATEFFKKYFKIVFS